MTLNKTFIIKRLKQLFYSFLILLGLLFYFVLSIYFGLWGKIPSNQIIANLKQSQATQILDKDNDLIGKLYIYDRQSIPYTDFPQHLIDALISTEDERFYEHNGIDNLSLARVFFKTILLSDDSSGGGSTITLQLAKNLFGRKNYGFLSLPINKIKESIIAKRIEKLYSKKEILTLYLNTVPFPDNTYGIESASQTFFNAHTKDLTISQASTLVGTLKANHSFNPRLFPVKSKARRNIVINQMKKHGYISEEETEKTLKTEIELDYHQYSPNQGLAPYFRAEIKNQLDSLLSLKQFKNPDGEVYNIYRDGLKVYTTLDNTMQKYAEGAVKEHLKKLQKQYEKAYGKNAPWLKSKKAFLSAVKRLRPYQSLKDQGVPDNQIMDSLSKIKQIELFSWDSTTVSSLSTLDSLEHYLKFLNVGLLSLEPTTGAVRAYVGGIDYRFFQYDHVSQSKRQVGSTFKPIVYTTAIENGMDPCNYYSVKPVTYTDFDDWTPTNATEIENENLKYSLENGLSNSVNTIAVKVLYETGIQNVIEQAHLMGINSAIEEVPSIALGSSNLTLIELAEAYTTFVNDSRPSAPLFITKIEDSSGNVIASYEDLHPKIKKVQAYSDDTRQVMLEFLKSTINNGTAQRLRTTYNFKNDLAGKTGTTQDNKDGWFVGIMPNLVTVIWVGNDNQQIGFSSTNIGQGANSALPIFANYLQELNKDSNYNVLTRARFEKPSDYVLQSIDCPLTKKESFFERLFRSNKSEKEFKKKKNGIFSWLKKKKNNP